MTTSDLVIPTAHINGTSEEELMRQLQQAVSFLEAGRQALAQTAPHGRDYYVQSDKGALTKATQQHEARMRKVKDVIDELTEIGTAIVERNAA